MRFQRTTDYHHYAALDSDSLRESFLIDDLFEEGRLALVGTDVDRAVLGGACPADAALELSNPDALRAEYFCERRELGVINLGREGAVEVDGENHALDSREVLYVGRGSRSVRFSGKGAKFYLVSFPAHANYPTTKVTFSEANHVELGSGDAANERVLHQYIHEKGAQSCQLVMGWTELKKGSVWNTMPAHTHERRSEIYAYFDVPEGQAVLHLMGEPSRTRHLWVRNLQAVLSPPWSIHAGCGTGEYKFVWAMGGENQRFGDMDGVSIDELK